MKKTIKAALENLVLVSSGTDRDAEKRAKMVAYEAGATSAQVYDATAWGKVSK